MAFRSASGWFLLISLRISSTHQILQAVVSSISTTVTITKDEISWAKRTSQLHFPTPAGWDIFLRSYCGV